MTKIVTSADSPIRVAVLPADLPGLVGLTLAPGKHAASKDGFRWARDLATDLDRLAGFFQTKTLICLLEDDELHRLRIPDLVAEATKRGIDVHRLPIPDGGVLPEQGPVEETVRVIFDSAAAGKNVVIHCQGGLGRAGTIGGCFLVEMGMSAEEAIATLHRCRDADCPETPAQERFIADYAKTRRGLRSFESRVAGTVLGAVIGDAMGHPTEFLSVEEIRRTYGPVGVQGFELFWEQAGVRFAPYTDDTQMAEAVARGLLECGDAGLDATMRAIGARFLEWARSPQGGHRAPGNACLAGCRALASGAYWSEAGGETAGGCGSVMRAYPFGLFFHDDLPRAEEWAVAHSKLTHRDPIALAACAAMAVGVARLLRSDPLELVVEEMVAAAGRYSRKTAEMMSRAAHEARTGVGPEVTLDRLRAWAAHEAIAAALYVFLRHPDDPRAAILEGANTPGDSDSIATLAGALAGARNGLAALPAEWVEQVERSEELLALARSIATLAKRSI